MAYPVFLLDNNNNLLKDKENLRHSRLCFIHSNFIVNLCGALTTYAFFKNKAGHCPCMWKLGLTLY